MDGYALAVEPRKGSPDAPAPYRFLHWLGHAAEADDLPGEASAQYARARELARASGDAFFESVAVRGLASAPMQRQEIPLARALLVEAVALARQVDNATIDYPALLAHFARLAAAENQPERAVLLAAVVATLQKAAGTHLFRYDRELLERRLEPASRLLPAAVAASAATSGQAMGREDALAYALLDEPGISDRLTPRELEILRMVAQGRSNREIAGDLVLSVRTVERHITNLYGKIGARGKAHATAYAFRHALT